MRIIDADELTEWVWRKRVDSRELIADLIASMPTIEAEQKHGRWIYYYDNGVKRCKCSECLTSYGCIDTPFCPNCGSLMNEVEE